MSVRFRLACNLLEPDLFNLVSHDNDLPDEPADAATFLVLGNAVAYAQPVLEDAEPGIPDPIPLELPFGGILTQDGNDWKIDFGNIDQSDTNLYLGNIIVENAAPAGVYSDTLVATFQISGTGFINSVAEQVGQQALGGSYLEVTNIVPDLTNLGSHEVTVVVDPSSVDISGTTDLPSITLTVTDNVVMCFVAGTRIAAVGGLVPVERLSIGDHVEIHSGGHAQIVWIGYRRVDCARHPEPSRVWPIRVAAGAFADAEPFRDVWLSPDHAVFVNGVLIPIRYLVNGCTIECGNHATK